MTLRIAITALLFIFLSACSFESDIDARLEKEFEVIEKASQGIENERELASIYAELAEKGNTEAMILLGDAYLFSQGVNFNPKKAIQLYKQSVNAGNYGAADALANVYIEGVQDENGRVYVEADPETGLMWTYIFLEKSDAGFIMEKLVGSAVEEGYKEMGVDVEQAKSRAEAWLKDHEKIESG